MGRESEVRPFTNHRETVEVEEVRLPAEKLGKGDHLVKIILRNGEHHH